MPCLFTLPACSLLQMGLGSHCTLTRHIYQRSCLDLTSLWRSNCLPSAFLRDRPRSRGSHTPYALCAQCALICHKREIFVHVNSSLSVSQSQLGVRPCPSNAFPTGLWKPLRWHTAARAWHCLRDCTLTLREGWLPHGPYSGECHWTRYALWRPGRLHTPLCVSTG